METSRLALLAPLLLAVPGLSQTVWNVTSPTGIQAAINTASPGDVIVLTASGGFPDYEPFALNKGVTIRGNGARIGYSPTFSAFMLSVNVPAGQVAHVDQIDCSYGYSPFGNLGCLVDVAGGSVRFERCTLSCGNGPALQIANATAVVSSSTLSGTNGAAGLYATNSQVTLRDSAVTGGNSACNPVAGCSAGVSPAGSAATLSQCTLHAERTTFVAGNNVITFPGQPHNGPDGILAFNCSLWLADCSVRGGDASAGANLGGTGLNNNGTLLAQLRQTTLLAGAPSGLTSAGPVNASAALFRAEQAPAFQRGTNSILTFRGDPNAAWGIWLAFDAAPSATSLVVEPLWILNGADIVFGQLDATGLATFVVAVPNSPVLQHAPVWCQAFSGLSLPLHASTLFGGIVH